MVHEEIDQQICIRRVALGSGRPEPLTIAGQRGRVHWKQHEVRVLGEHKQQRSTRLLDGYSNRLTTESMHQFSRPGFERFRRVGEIAMLDTAMGGEFERPAMRLICPIDSHECSKLDFIFLLRVYHWNAPLICETQAGSASAKIV